MFSGLCAICCDGVSDEHWTDIAMYAPYFEAAKKMYQYWLEFYTREDQ